MTRSEDMRVRILDTAHDLLNAEGRDAVTTRAITSALHIQAPTIYRIFGDKQGLLDQVALHGFAAHLATWTGWTPGADPIDSLRQGWDMHIDWGLRHPQVYSIAYGDPRDGTSSPAADAIDAILREQLVEAAKTGRLAVPVADAVDVIRAAGVGVVFTLLARPAESRDMSLSARSRDAALNAVLAVPAAPVTRTGAVMQIRHQLEHTGALTPNERALFSDWLDRVAR
ncbi:TetR/AcrR family transcriptional regulator [Curtobacterium citreum]|uniref:TetR/AcrR family transcriptional regulator n=1 Tax=Curtobacterium citreum TaxID=2036 RepID=UPI002542DAF3|nr:TetR/AcrR family transcriptional regulator [Curtobacterium citreum]WIJ46025.1 TetR/AcrR family transcriptional regulator [Curtobacterium citreum]